MSTRKIEPVPLIIGVATLALFLTIICPNVGGPNNPASTPVPVPTPEFVTVEGCKAPTSFADPSRGGNSHGFQWNAFQGSVALGIPTGEFYIFTASPGLVEMNKSFIAPINEGVWLIQTGFGKILWVALQSQSGSRAWGPAAFLVCTNKIVLGDLSLVLQEIIPWPVKTNPSG